MQRNMDTMKRRQFLAASLATSAGLAAPARLFAQAAPGPRDRKLLEIGREQVAKAGEALWRKDVLAIADFGLHSAQERFHFVDLASGTVNSAHVAHGSGSDPEHDGWLNEFSNVPNSWATSRGAYVTWEWYVGRFGSSVRLGGLDESNSNAFVRAIVMHPADYATPEHVARWGRLGRSNGCLALAPDRFREALYRLAGGRLIYADALGLGPDGDAITRPAQASVDFDGNAEVQAEIEAARGFPSTAAPRGSYPTNGE